jgi:capsular polysaccharide biosynthesis protein
VAIVASLVFTLTTPKYYDTSISFSINRINRQTTTEYQYDGYYAIQASDLFSQTVMSWFLTPSVLLEIYQKADIDPMIVSLEDLSARFKTKKYSPQNIVVRFKERDTQTAERISQAIIDIVQSKASLSNQTSDSQALFEVIGSKPVIVEKKPNIWLNMIIGFLAGIIFSIIIAYLVDFWRGSPTTEKNNI